MLCLDGWGDGEVPTLGLARGWVIQLLKVGLMVWFVRCPRKLVFLILLHTAPMLDRSPAYSLVGEEEKTPSPTSNTV